MSDFTSITPPRRNRRFFSFHRPHLCRGCGAPLGSGAGELRVSHARGAHRVHNQSSHACPRCLGQSEIDVGDDGHGLAFERASRPSADAAASFAEAR